MAFAAFNTPPHRRMSEGDVTNQVFNEEYNVAESLLMLSRSGGAVASEPTPTIPSAVRPSAQSSHKCSVCGKVFPSHQAFGGHKTSHRNQPTASAASINPCISGLNIRVYECSTCHKRFRKGQALGGHMRKHYEGLISVRGRNGTGGGNSGRNISQGVGGNCVTITSSYGGDNSGRNISQGVGSDWVTTASHGGDTNHSGANRDGDAALMRRSLNLYLPLPAELDLTLHL